MKNILSNLIQASLFGVSFLMAAESLHAEDTNPTPVMDEGTPMVAVGQQSGGTPMTSSATNPYAGATPVSVAEGGAPMVAVGQEPGGTPMKS